MKSSDIEIMRVYLCTLDRSLPYPNYNEVKLGDEDRLYGYLQKLIASNLGNVSAKEAPFTEEDELDKMVTDDPADLEMFVNVVTDKMYELVRDNAELTSGTAAFCFFMAEEQPWVGFFKMKFRENFLLTLSEEGTVNWPLHTKALPMAPGKDVEFFLINIYDRLVRVADVEAYIDDVKLNYLAESVLGIKAKPSEKAKVEAIKETTVDTICECYEEKDVPQKILEYKAEVAKQVEATGRVSVAQIEDSVFADNQKAADTYREKLEDEDIPRNPMPVSKKTEKQLCRKQKIVTDNGIELLVPVEYLKNDEYVEYLQDDLGNISIVLKSIKNIKA